MEVLSPQKTLQVIKKALPKDAPVFQVKAFLKDRHPFWQLLFIALSSRTKDEATLKALKRLMALAKDCKALASLPLKKVEKALYGVGFYKEKAKRAIALAKALAERNCQPPTTYEELIKLPGVGRKTAHVFLSQQGEAIGVDVHVHRIANRLGWVNTKTPEETEKALRRLFPKRLWRDLNTTLVAFGQTICKAKPKCHLCPLKEVCPSSKYQTQR